MVSVENLLHAWTEFVRGKRMKPDVATFSLRLMDNIFALHADLINHTYRHGGYQAFNISDPKPRNIHKASVRDRLVHHAIYRILYPFFDTTFIADSFSCRNGKGTHRALDRFRAFAYQVSKNHTQTCWVLKCDIKKFFAHIDHGILLQVLTQYISNEQMISLLQEIIGSFHAVRPGMGLPLGNLTSQLFVNIYMNEFDQYMKHRLKTRYYIRYADDFVILSHDCTRLFHLLPQLSVFLQNQLHLDLHPDKVSINTLASGIDLLGWVHFPDHRVLRTMTKRRMMKRIAENSSAETIQSYLGFLRHGNTEKLKWKIEGETKKQFGAEVR